MRQTGRASAFLSETTHLQGRSSSPTVATQMGKAIFSEMRPSGSLRRSEKCFSTNSRKRDLGRHNRRANLMVHRTIYPQLFNGFGLIGSPHHTGVCLAEAEVSWGQVLGSGLQQLWHYGKEGG